MIMTEHTNRELTDGEYLLGELEAIAKAEKDEFERENLDIDFDALLSLLESPNITRQELEQAKRYLTSAWGFNRRYPYSEQFKKKDGKYQGLIVYLTTKLNDKN